MKRQSQKRRKRRSRKRPNSNARSKPYTKATALARFNDARRTSRSRSADRSRRKNSAIINASDPRYYKARGTQKYDVENVDDGSPAARSVGKYANPQRTPHSLPPILVTVISKGRQIGRGAEATVWLYKRNVWKVFKGNISTKTIKENIKFLRKNKGSGVVPLLHSTSPRHKYIEMQYLRGYQTLQSYMMGSHRRKTYKDTLMRALADARAKLPHNVEYKDLVNFNNVMIHETKTKINVKFIEGGKAVVYPGKLRARAYVLKMAGLLHASRTPFIRNF